MRSKYEQFCAYLDYDLAEENPPGQVGIKKHGKSWFKRMDGYDAHIAAREHGERGASAVANGDGIVM